jgi:hypothetical protein
MNKLGRIEKVTATLRTLHQKAAELIRPDIEAELRISWARSGLAQKSEHGQGRLYDAATHPLIRADNRGIYITLKAGLEHDVYVQAGALQYGAMRGLKGYGARWRAKEKKYAAAGVKTGSGGKYIRAHPFFNLDDNQRRRLEGLYQERFVELFENMI